MRPYARILQIRQIASRFSFLDHCSLLVVLASYCCFSKLRKVRKRITENCRKTIFDKIYTNLNLKKRDLRNKSRFP